MSIIKVFHYWLLIFTQNSYKIYRNNKSIIKGYELKTKSYS